MAEWYFLTTIRRDYKFARLYGVVFFLDEALFESERRGLHPIFDLQFIADML